MILGQRIPSVVYVASTGPLVVIVELPAAVDEASDGLVGVAIERAAAVAAEL